MRFQIRLKLSSLVLFGTRWLIGLVVLFQSMALASEIPHQISGLDLVSGKSISHHFASASRGTVVLFLSTRCPCSASHQSILNQLAEEFGKKGFAFVGVHSNANETLEESKQFFSTQKFAFPVIQDSGCSIADQFRAFKTPHAYLLSPQAEILFQGGVDDSKIAGNAKRHYLKDAMTDILEGHEPKEKNVRVVGCQIQRP